MNLEYLKQTMMEIGPLTDQILSVVQHGESQWELAFEDNSVMSTEYDEAAHKLTFSLDVGPVPAEGREHAYELMLVYNSCWRDTGGIRVAIDDRAGNVLLLFDLFAQNLDVSQLSTIVAGLLKKQMLWREALGKVVSGGNSDSSHDQADALRI